MASWNNLPLEMSLQVTNLFDGLLLIGAIPSDHDYQKRVYNWIKWNVLQKIDLNCQEDEWLMIYTNYFYHHIANLWKENKGIVMKSDFFFNEVINHNENSDHCCLKCSPPMKKNKKIILIPNQVKYTNYIKCIYIQFFHRPNLIFLIIEIPKHSETWDRQTPQAA